MIIYVANRMDEPRKPSAVEKKGAEKKSTKKPSKEPQDDDPACRKHKNPSVFTRCLYGRSGKKGCTKCEVEDLKKSVTEANERLEKLQDQIINLPAEQLDSSKALDGLFITLGKVMIELRACSFTTFTSRRRLDAIRQDVKAARAHVDTLQEAMVAQVKANDLLRRESAARAQAAQELGLQDFFRKTGGEGWVRKDLWGEGEGEGGEDWAMWFGVSARQGFVNKLELTANNLTGRVPRSVVALNALEELSLAKNQLRGPIPSAIGELTSLKVLYLSDNMLEGHLPDSLSKLSRLRVLYVSGNRLGGTLPESLSALQSLEVMGVANNQLRGPIPTTYAALHRLKKLDLSRNLFQGPVPPAITELPRLEELRLSDGQIPKEEESKLLSSSLVTIQRVAVPPSKRVASSPKA